MLFLIFKSFFLLIIYFSNFIHWFIAFTLDSIFTIINFIFNYFIITLKFYFVSYYLNDYL